MLDTLFEAFWDSLVEFRWWRRMLFLILLGVMLYLGVSKFTTYGLWLGVFLLFEFLGWLGNRKRSA